MLDLLALYYFSKACQVGCKPAIQSLANSRLPDNPQFDRECPALRRSAIDKVAISPILMDRKEYS